MEDQTRKAAPRIKRMISTPVHLDCLYQGVIPSWQCLYFLPLPQGHGSFRFGFIAYPVFVR